MGYSINVFLIVTAVFGHHPFLTEPVTTEFTSARLFVDAKANVQLFTVIAMGSFILAQEFKGKEPLLKMVIIRVRSSIEVNQLRRAHIDIVRIRPDPERPPGDNLFSGGFIVEAVVTVDQLNKLEAMGFEVSELSEDK